MEKLEGRSSQGKHTAQQLGVQALESEHVGKNPGSFVDSLCELGEVPWPLQMSVSSSIKWG